MEDIQLIHGDCLVEMQNIPDKSVDCVLCDPPYGIDYQSARRTDKEARLPKIANDKKPFTDFIPLLPRHLKDTGCALIFTRWDVQQVFIDELNNNGLGVKSIIIWDKLKHGMGNLTQEFGRRYESIIFACKKHFIFPNKRPVDIISYPSIPSGKLIHPNEKPVSLLGILIQQITPPYGVVMDCTMGSGSCGVAAVNTNRKFIGIELDKNYFDIAKQRIDEAIKKKNEKTLFD